MGRVDQGMANLNHHSQSRIKTQPQLRQIISQAVEGLRGHSQDVQTQTNLGHKISVIEGKKGSIGKLEKSLSSKGGTALQKKKSTEITVVIIRGKNWMDRKEIMG